MRWQFPDPNDVTESERRTALLLAIDRFWQQFTQVATEISKTFARQAKFDVGGFMQQSLGAVDQRLCWEYGRAVRGDGHRLVITPESTQELRPLVEVLLSRAPTLPAWEFYAHRLAENLEEAIMTTEGRAEVDVSRWRVQVTPGEHHLLDLKWLIPRGTDGEKRLQYAAFVASESLLGEEVLGTWIGEISVEEPPRPKKLGRILGRSSADSETPDLGSLKTRTESAIAAIEAELPALPHSSIDQDTAEYSMFSLEPREQDDYAQRFDLFTAISSAPEMWLAAHSGLAFESRRFSKCGETFCYVKMDGRDSDDHLDVDARTKVEEALNAVLRPHALGSAIGGGTGRRYTYIDLAIRHLDQGLAEIRRVLRELGVPERSWILFFDTHLSAEWLGIYETTPAPPAANDEDDEDDEDD